MVRKYCRLILFIAAVAAVVLYFPEIWVLLRKVFGALKPVFVAVFLALVFHIPINFLSSKVFKKIKKEKVRYALSLAVVYVLVFGLLFTGIYFLAPEVVESVKGFAEKLPEYGRELAAKLSGSFAGIGLTEEKINGEIAKLVDKFAGAGDGVSTLLSKLKNLGGEALNLFFAIVLSVYMLLDRKRLMRQFRQFSYAILPRKVYDIAHKTTTVGGVIFAKFLGGQVIEAVLLGLITLAGMYALKLPYAPLVSAVVFVSNLIPLLGAYIGGVVGFILIAFVNIKQALIFVVFSIVLQQLENNITYPRVVGNSLGLSGFWVMAAVLVGGALFGFWGVMLGVPAVAVVYKMLGYTLARQTDAGALIPDVLKQPDKEGSDDGADKRGDKGDGNSAP